jgi:SAM-dependent methyltransferase
MSEAAETWDVPSKVARFYDLLREEVTTGNSFLSADEQLSLQSHYDVMRQPERFHPTGVRSIYVRRRAPAVEFIERRESPVVLDAGCGYGSESFLFAAAGARVLGVDRSERQIEIAVKRRRFFEERLNRTLDVHFEVSDLESYRPARSDITLTWLASVLAPIEDQKKLLQRIQWSTECGGRIMITDMNLLNPRFFLHIAARIHAAKTRSVDFGREGDLWAMLRRRGRKGARYFLDEKGRVFDDVQFFWSRTLSRLLSSSGFNPVRTSYSGFLPPYPIMRRLFFLDEIFARLPLLRCFGYFYLMVGHKQSADMGASKGAT